MFARAPLATDVPNRSIPSPVAAEPLAPKPSTQVTAVHNAAAAVHFAPVPSSAPESFAGESAVRALTDVDYELFLRTIDLVVLSQAFSTLGLQHALRISEHSASQMTALLAAVGVIRSGDFVGHFTVAAGLRELPVLIAILGGSRAPLAA